MHINKKIASLIVTSLLLVGCNKTTTTTSSTSTPTASTSSTSNNNSWTSNISGILDTIGIFSDRDLQQSVDTSEATTYTVSDNQDINITSEGTYVITGSASNVTISVEVDDTSKVQIVLNNASISNSNRPVIYVKSGDKVFINLVGNNTLSVTDTFTTDGEVNTDAVIFSKSDLTLNGTGSLTINSSDNGITSKDDITITGGTYNLTVSNKAIEAHDSIAIYDGTFTINAADDGIHAEDSDDTSVGYVYIYGGTFNITAEDDGIHATTVLQVDGGTFTINATEAMEATYVQINGGNTTINASDDGINASEKSTSYEVTIEINGGTLAINMAQGDTDALDANGKLIVNGGDISITGPYAFDFDTTSEFNGGEITVNGEQVTEITESMQMGGGMRGNRRP